MKSIIFALTLLTLSVQAQDLTKLKLDQSLNCTTKNKIFQDIYDLKMTKPTDGYVEAVLSGYTDKKFKTGKMVAKCKLVSGTTNYVCEGRTSVAHFRLVLDYSKVFESKQIQNILNPLDGTRTNFHYKAQLEFEIIEPGWFNDIKNSTALNKKDNGDQVNTLYCTIGTKVSY